MALASYYSGLKSPIPSFARNLKENRMKKILISLTLLFSIGTADSVLLVKKGWQLIGSSTPMKSMSAFSSTNVEQVWHFDATTQQWLGYSPDTLIQKKITDQNISTLDSLKNWHGFWIKSKKDWALTFPTLEAFTPTDENQANDIIELKKGWNLISLPIDTVVSADIFKDLTVWKYNPNEEWEFFDKKQSEADFPKLGHIKNSDGLWVKAPSDQNISVIAESSKLHNFSSTGAMEEAIKAMAVMAYRPYCGIELLGGEKITTSLDIPVATPTAVMDSESVENETVRADDASGTNLQEQDVDESDIVKHNGTHIFYKVSNERDRINITSFTELAKGNTQPLDKIVFDDNRQINSFYLTHNRLVVLSSFYGYDEYKIVEDDVTMVTTSTTEESKEQVWVDIFDVADIKNIKSIANYKIDGYIIDSRVLGDELYLISSFRPKFNITYPREYIELSATCQEYFDRREDELPPYPIVVPNEASQKSTLIEDENQYASCYGIQKEYKTNRYYRTDYENPKVEVLDLTPEIENRGVEQPLIVPSRLYSSSKQKQETTLTTISNISITEGNYKQSNSFIGFSSVQYASSKALYLVSNAYPIYYDFNNYKERSTIYTYNLDSELSYSGMGAVYGHALNQFALSEHNDILRIATTEGFSWGASGTKNSIYTLKEQDNLLTIQGVLSGLGKEGETIKSVRFMGDKAYVVTFRQTDPLYTIDMSNPEKPTKMGELHVNGYSAYLHPIAEDKLLGIGRDADANGNIQGVKIELFDISDFANPSSLDSIVLSQGSSSELEQNHKALAYRPSDHLFAFPYQVYGNYDNDYTVYNYLGVYQVKENELLNYKAIKSSNSGWGEQRGLIFDMNETTYISFFANDKITTDTLKEK